MVLFFVSSIVRLLKPAGFDAARHRCAIFAALFALSLPCAAQPTEGIRRAAAKLDDLVNEGQYAAAAHLAQSVLDQLHRWGHQDQAVIFLSYLGKNADETGRLHDALEILNMADSAASHAWDDHDTAAFLRERAALYYDLADYNSAATTAAKAYKYSIDKNYYKIRTAYCRSIQALAFLRLGDAADAEKLVLEAVRAAPKKPGKLFVFAPRVLYAACIVESHAGKHAEAEDYCRRGLEIAAATKNRTRDLTLGYLAMAESRLQAGDIETSQKAAATTIQLARQIFGPQHQDIVHAEEILAETYLKQGNTAAATGAARDAMKNAIQLFGDGAPGLIGPNRLLKEVEAKQEAPPQ